MTAERGHLFVVQGDMTRLAADAYLIPWDGTYVNPVWDGLVTLGESSPNGQWRTLLDKATPLDNGVWVVSDTTPDHPMPDQVVGVRVMVDTVATTTIEGMVDRALRAIEEAAKRSSRHLGRHLPLVALPILGVGAGLYPTQRAEVMDVLITKLTDFVSVHPIDVALVLYHRSDVAAAQWIRAQRGPTKMWTQLSQEQRELATSLGDMAAAGSLAVFAGAGVSKPLGMPDWKELLTTLAESVGKPGPNGDCPDYPGFADDLGIDGLADQIVQRFETDKHALSHALLVNLRTSALVTTNYDRCLENAAAVVHGEAFRVMAKQLSGGAEPWLLKLHGSVDHPDLIVLGRASYKKLERERRALRSVVETLMLTKHLLFVGFGFAEDDFAAMSDAVDAVRKLAKDQQSGSVGTAIKLLPGTSRDRTYSALDVRVIGADGEEVSSAARRLEILLDMVAWWAQVKGKGTAAYLLDEKYAHEFTERGPDPDRAAAEDRRPRDAADEARLRAAAHDARLRPVLMDLAAAVKEAPDSSAAGEVNELLRRLGYRGE